MRKPLTHARGGDNHRGQKLHLAKTLMTHRPGAGLAVGWLRRVSETPNALAQLDSEGLFGTGTERLRVMINVEVMPPDKTNTERANRLNPEAAIQQWLKEAAE